MYQTIIISSLLGLVLPMIIFYFNKGYLSANRYLASFLFFISLNVLETCVFFYSISLQRIAFATHTHAFFFLIGPFAFFYIRSVLRDNSKLSKTDYLHFALFVISFIGYIPYFFTSWDYKLMIAQNIMSENWDIAQFNLNLIFPYKMEQIFNLLQSYFYVILLLWYLIRYYKKRANSAIINTKQFKLIRNWALVFVSLYTITTLNFTAAIVHIWIYDDKFIFLDRASIALFLASIVYIVMNMIVMFSPHIMYGLPIDLALIPLGSGLPEKPETNYLSFNEASFIVEDDSINNITKIELHLFTIKYKAIIEASLETSISQKAFLSIDFKLAQISNDLGIPAHHLTYFFNGIKKISFSDWRNSLRIEYAKELINQGVANTITLQALSLECGFASQSTFIRAFKNVTGNSPSYYMKTHS